MTSSRKTIQIPHTPDTMRLSGDWSVLSELPNASKSNFITLQQLIKALGDAVKKPGRVYLVGGATAVLLGWRDSTIDVDLKVIPDSEILKSLSDIKERLQINIELALPDDFIPELPGWQERSPFIQRAVERVVNESAPGKHQMPNKAP
jgi:hypothetical protein